MSDIRDSLLAIGPVTIFYFLCCIESGNLISPDSIYYINIAENVANYGQYIGPGGKAIIYWPPLYSLILIPSLFFTSYTFLLQLVLLITHQVIWVTIVKKMFSKALNVQFTLAILGLNTLILMCSVYVWSELLFMVFMSLAVYFSLTFIHTQKKVTLIGVGGSLMLALLTRNAGVFFIPGFLVFGFFAFRKTIRLNYLVAVLFGASGNLLWNVHRIFLLEHLHVFQELVPYFSLSQNFLFTMEEIMANFFPRSFVLHPWFLLLTVASLILLIYKNFPQLSEKEILLGLIILSSLVFWFIIPAEKDNLGRFLAPIFPLFLILLQTHLKRVFANNRSRRVLIFINIYLVVFSLVRIVSNAENWSSLI